jgi:hypothetical protein
VILRDWTNNYVDGSVRAFNDRPATNFLGVYSGRMRTAPDKAQIGLVWHALMKSLFEMNETNDGSTPYGLFAELRVN